MTRVNNLYNLHKVREAKVSDDGKYLIICYEMRKPTGLKIKKYQNKFRSRKIGITGELEYDQKFLSIKITSKDCNVKKLYSVLMVIAYILADEITLYYRYKDFSYYDLPQSLNFGGYGFSFVNRRLLIENTKAILECGYDLLNSRDTHFSEVVPYLLSINTITYYDVRFFSEYSILEKISQEHSKVSGTFFSEKGEKKKLENLVKELLRKFDVLIEQKRFSGLSNYAFKNKVKRSISKDSLNQKGTTKDKITLFIESFSLRRIRDYTKYIKQWNTLRNRRGIAHGSGLRRGNKKSSRDVQLSNHMHELLAEIVYYEFHSALKK